MSNAHLNESWILVLFCFLGNLGLTYTLHKLTIPVLHFLARYFPYFPLSILSLES